jgi:monooxygenase
MADGHVDPAGGEHVDVLIVGAGLSGIGAACRLSEECPGKRFAILEGRGASGGTWDVFRFPGVRSDSDMYTLSYPFRPWLGDQAMADGPSILEYVRATAREYGIDRRIRFHHRVLSAAWSSEGSRWTVEVERLDTGEVLRMTCNFLYSCTGYYRHDRGYDPGFAGAERFRGQIVHPQFWTDDVDHAGKRVVVIGSGATAVTLVPALAQSAAHVTMLQRSPSYVLSVPARDPLAGLACRVLPARLAYSITRWRYIAVALWIYRLCRRRPERAKRMIRALMERRLPPGYDIDKHFTPRYAPWDQRLCLVPDNDLFDAISAGSASVVTDEIDTFTETGIALRSGGELEADLIVTATGLDMVPFGGIELSVDGREVEVPRTIVYRGMMLSDVPNMAFAFGYINQSWTLGADLSSEHVCRLLGYMDRHGYVRCTPRASAETVPSVPFAALTSGYIQRALDRFPRQAAHDPWQRQQNYALNRRAMRRAPLSDPALEFSVAGATAPTAASVAA